MQRVINALEPKNTRLQAHSLCNISSELHLNQTHEPFLIQFQTRLPSDLDLPKLQEGSINVADPKFVRPTHTTKHGHKLKLTHTLIEYELNQFSLKHVSDCARSLYFIS